AARSGVAASLNICRDGTSTDRVPAMRFAFCLTALLTISASAFAQDQQPPPPPPPGWQQQPPPPPPPPNGGPPPGWQACPPNCPCPPGNVCPPQNQPPPPPPPPQGGPPPGWLPCPPNCPCPPGNVCAPHPPPQAPVQNKTRGGGEMVYLYGTGLAYGVGTGIWIDVLAHSSDPAVGTIAPILFDAGVPLGFFLWDYLDTFRPGVPASMATGMWLGFAEGVAISSIQVATTGDQKRWDLSTAMTIPFITTTVGGIGGYFFGRWREPDPRAGAFIAEGMAWGAGTGVMLGIGASADGRPGSEKSSGDGAAVGTLLGANIGIAGTSALVIGGYQPSWQAQKWMWLGYTAGAAIPSLVYLAY